MKCLSGGCAIYGVCLISGCAVVQLNCIPYHGFSLNSLNLLQMISQFNCKPTCCIKRSLEMAHPCLNPHQSKAMEGKVFHTYDDIDDQIISLWAQLGHLNETLFPSTLLFHLHVKSLISLEN